MKLYYLWLCFFDKLLESCVSEGEQLLGVLLTNLWELLEHKSRVGPDSLLECLTQQQAVDHSLTHVNFAVEVPQAV